MCPLGFPSTMDIPETVCLVETDCILILCLYILVSGYWCNYFCFLQDASIVSTDDDYIPDIFDSQIKENSGLSMELPGLLSANQLLELVCYPFLTPVIVSVLNCVWSSFHINTKEINNTLCECRFLTHLIQLGEFLYQLHMMCLIRIWLITVKCFWWENITYLDWRLPNRSKNVLATPL
jgi:hypothetical protein